MSANATALRDLVVERMVVAADEIVALFEQAFAEYQETVRSKLLQDHKYHMEKNPKEELQREDIRAVVVQTDVHHNLECIKNEEEEIPLSLQFPPVTATSMDNINKSIFFEPEPSEEQAQIEYEGEEFEGEEYHEEKYEGEDYQAAEYEGEKPGCSLDSDQEFRPRSFSDTDDSDDWKPLPKRKRKSRKKKNGFNQKKESNDRPGNASSIDREQLETIIRNAPFIGTKVKSFSCLLCNNSFSEKHYLSQHMRVHTGERPYRCEPCGVTFRFQQNFHQHNLAVHPKEKPHRCKVCNQEFAEMSELIAHKETHKDKEPYKCLNCNKTFMCIKSLMSHKMSQRCL